MKTIFFTDLDDSLFSTARKQQPNADFILSTTLKDGSPSGYQSPKQQAFLKLWQENSLIIPVTARGYDAFSRVDMQFESYSVIDHGGIILDGQGEILQEWHTLQQQNSASTTVWLQQQYQYLLHIADELQADIRIKVNADHDLDLYVLLKSNTNSDSILKKIVEIYQTKHADELNHGYIHINANNLAILPNWLGKEHAVAFLKEKLAVEFGDFLAVGCGDSMSDIDFMKCCDFWIAPTNSQISSQI